MITDLVVEDYQAVKEARLRLKMFTVVTGPTGSGKSAIIRALRMVVFNQRGTSFVRAGAKSARAAVGVEGEHVVVGIERGKVNAYRVVSPSSDPLSSKAEVQNFTKLAGTVPEEVTAVLRLSDVNFSGQHDPLFLLTSSGGEVARRLGELTNVTLLLDAAREANRRRLEVSRQLQAAEREHEDLFDQLPRFASLKEQLGAMAAADAKLVLVKQMQIAADYLAALIRTASQAQAALDAAAVPDLPDIGRLCEIADRRSRLVARLSELHVRDSQAGGLRNEAVYAARAQNEALAELKAVLTEAGRCPTCGQPVDGFKLLAVDLYGDGRV